MTHRGAVEGQDSPTSFLPGICTEIWPCVTCYIRHELEKVQT